MTRDLLRGAASGATFGLWLALASVAVPALLLRHLMELPPDPVDGVTLGYAALSVGVAAVLGAAIAGFGGARVRARPALLPAILPAPFVALAAATATWPVPQILAVGLGFLGWRLGARWPKLGAGLVLLLLGAGLAQRLAAPHPDATPPQAGAAPAGAPNVLWVVFDTVRADHLPTGGSTRPTAPRLAALADEGVVFEAAQAPAAWTLPSHASMMTGTYPSRHGCHDQHLALDGARPTVAALLAGAGWDTVLLSSNPWVGDSTGLGRGFARRVAAWRDTTGPTWFPVAALLRPWLVGDKGATAVDRAFSAWLDDRDTDRPFFAFVNYLEAHAPYAELAAEDRAVFVPEAQAAAAAAASHRYDRFQFTDPAGTGPTLEEHELLLALYDAGVRADDRHLGLLLDALAARDLADDTLIVVTADHGEAFGEQGRWGHHVNATDEVLHVPLVLRLPGRAEAGRRVTEPVSLVDLLPTVLDAAGLGAQLPDGVEGRSLLGLARGEPAAPRPVYAEGFPPSNPVQGRQVAALGLDPAAFRWRRVRLGDAALLAGPGGETGEAALRPLLQAFAARGDGGTGAVAPLDAATSAELRRLGYLE